MGDDKRRRLPELDIAPRLEPLTEELIREDRARWEKNRTPASIIPEDFGYFDDFDDGDYNDPAPGPTFH